VTFKSVNNAEIDRTEMMMRQFTLVILLVCAAWTVLILPPHHPSVAAEARGMQNDFMAPVIDGVLNDSCWGNQMNTTFTLANWTIDFDYPYPPPYDELNGTIVATNDNNYLYLGVQVFNATNSFEIYLKMDDNVTEHDSDFGYHRGAIYSRGGYWASTLARELWLFEEIYWVYWSGGPSYRIWDGSEDEVYIHWVWQNKTKEWGGEVDVAWILEGAFRFRWDSNDPAWLLERVPFIRVHLVMEIGVWGEWKGIYVFPPESERGASTEAEIAEWWEVPCTFNLPPTSTYPPVDVLAWVLVGGVVFGLATIVGIVFLRRRRTQTS